MRCFVAALVLVTVGGAALGQRKAEVELLEVKARRLEDGAIVVDGRVRSGASKPIKDLSMAFDFLAADNEPLTTQTIAVEQDLLKRGEETGFHAEARNPPGAVRFRVRAIDGSGKELRISNKGPFPVE
jgi:hypothetical protein